MHPYTPLRIRFPRCGVRRRERGYVLLTLMLAVTLLTIAAAACLPAITFEIRRDKEEEMVHRGVQYSRAIRAYYKKFSRYPTRLQDLDNTNNLRYLRKHYKDPITGQDFKLLHYGDPGVTLAGGFGGAGIAGATPAGNLNAPTSGSAFGSNSSFGNSSPNGSAFGQQSSGFGGNSPGGGTSTFGGNSNGGLGGSSSSFGNSSNPSGSQTAAAPNGSDSSAAPGTPGAPGSDPTQASTQVAPGTAQGDVTSSSQPVTLGGGAILGVASISKKPTIREYNKKRKYSDWQFIYDPIMDRGGLISTPYQPQLQSLGNQNLNGQPGSNSTNGNSPFGQSNGTAPGQSPNGGGFGQSSGFGNNNSGFGNGGNPPSPAPNPPQQ